MSRGRSGFRLNRKGGAEVLNELSAPMINALGQQIAAAAGPDAEFEPYTTDRAGASVRVPAEQQAKDGVLTKAVAAAGYEVVPKK